MACYTGGSILKSGMYTLSVLNNKKAQSAVAYSAGTYKLAHKSEYRIKVENNHPTLSANAKIIVDGKPIGTFRIDSNDYCNIERPGDNKKSNKFVFLDKTSDQGKTAKLDSIEKSKLGTIVVEISRQVPCRKEVVYKSLNTTKQMYPYDCDEDNGGDEDDYDEDDCDDSGGWTANNDDGPANECCTVETDGFDCATAGNVCDGPLTARAPATATVPSYTAKRSNVGGTGLGDHSTQVFVTVPKMKMEYITTLCAKMVLDFVVSEL